MNVIPTDRVLVDLNTEEIAGFSHHRSDDFLVFKEAPPANRVVRFKSDMMGALGVERAKASPFAYSERAAVLLRSFG